MKEKIKSLLGTSWCYPPGHNQRSQAREPLWRPPFAEAQGVKIK